MKNIEVKSLVLTAGATKFASLESQFLNTYGEELGTNLESQLASKGRVKLSLRLKSSFNKDTPKPYRFLLQSDQELSQDQLVSAVYFGALPEKLTLEQLADLPRLSSFFELGERLPKYRRN